VSATLPASYPTLGPQRDEWILARRPERNALNPLQPYAFFVEEEYSAAGEIVPVTTVFLANKECPWRCLMCDLWRNTLTETVSAGAIPAQIEYALQRLTSARQIKLYNSGSFFDLQAVPLRDHSTIAGQVAGFDRVIVESHPALIGENCFRFRDRLAGRLEVAMGLETAHSEILERLNKRMTIDQFAAAASLLRKRDIDLRVFILVKPPFMREDEALEWAKRSLDFAFDCGATAATLIPTRGGNGAMEELAAAGEFSPPRLTTLEAAVAYGLSLHRGRVFADLWELKTVDACSYCHESRISRLRAMNLQQAVLPPISCSSCEAAH
jgi:radical SAM enzyme (TIGR01210 family)